MPQARQRPNAGGVNRLEERLWPSSPAKRLCAARRRDGHAYPINRLGKRPANQSAYAEK